MGKNFEYIYLFVLTEFTKSDRRKDRRTDKWTDNVWQHRLRLHSIALQKSYILWGLDSDCKSAGTWNNKHGLDPDPVLAFFNTVKALYKYPVELTTMWIPDITQHMLQTKKYSISQHGPHCQLWWQFALFGYCTLTDWLIDWLLALNTENRKDLNREPRAEMSVFSSSLWWGTRIMNQHADEMHVWWNMHWLTHGNILLCHTK